MLLQFEPWMDAVLTLRHGERVDENTLTIPPATDEEVAQLRARVDWQEAKLSIRNPFTWCWLPCVASWFKYLPLGTAAMLVTKLGLAPPSLRTRRPVA